MPPNPMKGFTKICSVMDTYNFMVEQNKILKKPAVVRKYRKLIKVHALGCKECVRVKNE